MKVILTDRVKSLGGVGEIVNVSAGHARNYLIPNKLAKLADEGNAKQMEDYQKMLSKRVAEELSAAEAIAKKLAKTTVTIIKKVGGNGSLFGTVTNTELAKALEEKDISIERRLINVDTPIKVTGTFEISAKIFKGVEATFKVEVKMDPKQAEEMKAKQEAAAKKRAEKAIAPEVAEEAAESTEAERTTEE